MEIEEGSGNLSDEEEEIINFYKEQITLDNFENYKSSAKTLIKDQDYEEAKLLLSAMISKGSEIYNSELNINLAECYFELGNIFLNMVEEQDDNLFGQEGQFSEELIGQFTL